LAEASRGDPVLAATNLGRVFRVAFGASSQELLDYLDLFINIHHGENEYASEIDSAVLIAGRCTNTELADGRDVSTSKEAQEISTSEALTI
jgi:hypothetical protein